MALKRQSDVSNIPSSLSCEHCQFMSFSSNSRILEKDESNIDAWQILTVHELAREGNTATVSHPTTQKLSQGQLFILSAEAG